MYGYTNNKTITLYTETDLDLYMQALDDLKIEYIQAKSNTFLAIADLTIYYNDSKILDDISSRLKELYEGVF